MRTVLVEDDQHIRSLGQSNEDCVECYSGFIFVLTQGKRHHLVTELGFSLARFSAPQLEGRALNTCVSMSLALDLAGKFHRPHKQRIIWRKFHSMKLFNRKLQSPNFALANQLRSFTRRCWTPRSPDESMLDAFSPRRMAVLDATTFPAPLTFRVRVRR